MASTTELLQYAQAKQRKNGLAEIAGHFIKGASAGYEAGRKSKLDHLDEILKTAQADEAQQKSRELKIQNDFWMGAIDEAKGAGRMPMTAGEEINGRVATSNQIGQNANASPGSFDLAKIADRFFPKNGNYQTTMTMKTPFGTITRGPKPRTPESSDTANKREKRILKEKIYKQALAATQAEDMMATEPNAKYLGQAARYYGEDPAEYMPKNTGADDPFGLLGGGN